jgi:glutathione S-transferase
MSGAPFTIWGRLNSHNVKKVAWFAEELGLDYRRIDIGGQFGFSDEYLEKNPNRLIPTIEDGSLVLWESNAILRYMAARHGGERWYPTDPAERALADRWMDWQMTYADAQRVPFLSFARMKPEDRDMEAITRDIARCARHLAVMERYLGETPWLSGAQFGIGDIPMGVYAYTWFSLPFDKPEFANLAAWYRRIRERPGFAEQVMIPLT